MSESTPDLHMLNVVVRDMVSSLAFYARLGVAVPPNESRRSWPPQESPDP